MIAALCGLLISPARQHHIRGVACKVWSWMSNCWPERQAFATEHGLDPLGLHSNNTQQVYGKL